MAHQVHRVDGKRVPSVTTVTGRFKDSGGLIFWANAVGLGDRDCDDQEPCKKCGLRAGKNHRDVVKKAADIGDLGHDYIECAVKGTELDMSKFAHLDEEQLELGQTCKQAFDRWWAGSDVKIMETEYPLTSQELKFGGTFDACGWVQGRFALIDWKTSNDIYPDYCAQLAGYVILIEEHGMPDVEEIHILRVSKKTGAFHHVSLPRKTFQPAIDYFVQARKLYDMEKDLKAVLK